MSCGQFACLRVMHRGSSELIQPSSRVIEVKRETTDVDRETGDRDSKKGRSLPAAVSERQQNVYEASGIHSLKLQSEESIYVSKLFRSFK